MIAVVIVAEAEYSHFHVDTKMTYADAVAHCRSLDHDLVNVESKPKQDEVYKMMVDKNFKRMWIGINRRNDTHDNYPYEWHYERIPMQPIRAFFWATGEPNNFRNDQERCVEILDRKDDPRYIPDHNWNDKNCNDKNPFMCERY